MYPCMFICTCSVFYENEMNKRTNDIMPRLAREPAMRCMCNTLQGKRHKHKTTHPTRVRTQHRRNLPDDAIKAFFKLRPVDVWPSQRKAGSVSGTPKDSTSPSISAYNIF